MPEVSTLTGQHGSFEGCRTVPKRGGETPWREMSSLVTKKFAATRGKADVQLGEISQSDHSISFREYLAKKGGRKWNVAGS